MDEDLVEARLAIFRDDHRPQSLEVVGNLFASRAPTGPRQHALGSRHKPVDLLGDDVGDSVGVALTEQPDLPPVSWTLVSWAVS
ncbi:hypothetical protein [Streptomyces sp. NBC_01483]|uniref:hypothetical protein n=1 Tax=Streptomyces sp. NBC_01483 TaxID=2903883 RepID=UPI002E317DEE|nr:hypothetical protein [Streptomyces sp. NBC_01483]